MRDDDDFNPYEEDEPTAVIETQRLTPAQQRPADPTPPPAGADSDRRWLVVLGIVALVLLAIAIALGVSRAGWKDRATDAEAELGDAKTAAAQAEQDAADAQDAADQAAADAEADAEDAIDDSGSTDSDTGDDAATDSEDAESTEDVVTDCEDFGVDGGAPDGAGYYAISTRNLDCDQAKQLILGRGFDAESRPDADEYTCTKLEQGDETATFRCESGDQAFRYSAGA